MGMELVKLSGAAKQVFEEADGVLGTLEGVGVKLSELCFNGPEEALNDTYNTQPAIYTASAAYLAALKEFGTYEEPEFVAGHSLGEYTAYYAAGAFSFADGLKLVRERGRLMKLAGERSPGGIAAIIGMDDEVIDGVCADAQKQTGGVVQPANYNSPGQVVISGDEETLTLAMKMCEEQKAKRVIRLAVSIAVHSPLMAVIGDEFRDFVNGVSISEAKIPVVANITAAPISKVEDMHEEMVGQLTSPVRWTKSMQFMLGEGLGKFYEVGPGKVLAGLGKRIDRKTPVVSVSQTPSLFGQEEQQTG
jgi:[acyl-carrier-protein] S-malonyltransferase